MEPRGVLAWALGGHSRDRIRILALAVVAGLLVALFHNLIHVLENYVNTKLNLSMGLDFRGDLFQHAQRLSMSYHDRAGPGC